MSDPLRIALVAEGPTDRVVIEAALQAMPLNRPFILKQIFPESSAAFGPLGTGWAGVYRWCHSSVGGGQVRLDGSHPMFAVGNFDLLILHLDGDVAGETYSAASICPLPGDGALPCQQPCPPPRASTDALRPVLLSWCGESTTPASVVMCTPSKNTEAWVVAALYPADPAMRQGIECHPDPASRLGQQKLDRRLRKRERDYLARLREFQAAWPRLAAPEGLSEASRFQGDLLAALRQVRPG